MRTTWVLALALIGSACSARPATGDDGASTTMMEGDTDGDTSTGSEPGTDLPSGDGDGDGDGDPLADPCGCDDGQLCVGDCTWGDFNPDSIQNARCIDATICDENGWESSPCIELACGSPFASLSPDCLGPNEGTGGFDIVCDPSTGYACDETIQDCPEGEKCVPQLPDPWGYVQNRCVAVVGTGAPGESCTSEGANPDSDYTDSCAAESLCWNGMITGEPFEGICQPFCFSWKDPVCPEQTSCELVTETFELCMPSP